MLLLKLAWWGYGIYLLNALGEKISPDIPKPEPVLTGKDAKYSIHPQHSHGVSGDSFVDAAMFLSMEQ